MLYVSPVRGHLAPRHGTARVTPGRNIEHVLSGVGAQKRTVTIREPGTVWGHEFFGVTRARKKDAEGKVVQPLEWEITWDETLVAAISDRELQQFRREYKQLIADGALRERTKADHDAYLAAQHERGEEHDASVKAATEEATVGQRSREIPSTAAPVANEPAPASS